jgi:alpha-tubulin suppressor-like RCC1 family protein
MENNNITKVAVWYEHTILIRNGSAWSFGRNDNGRLCLGNETSFQLFPSLVTGFSNMIDVSVGNGHTILLSSDGIAYACGLNGVFTSFY